MRVSVLVALVAVALGCTSRRGVHPDADFGDVAAGLDASTEPDASGGRDAGIDAARSTDGGLDAAAHDAGTDAWTSGGGLDPRLDVPPASNEPCSSPRSLSECSGIAVCRFYSATEGRCESCTACGNLFASCASGEDCDILFVCFEASAPTSARWARASAGRPRTASTSAIRPRAPVAPTDSRQPGSPLTTPVSRSTETSHA